MGNAIEGFAEIIEQPLAGEPVSDKETVRGHMCLSARDRSFSRDRSTGPRPIRYAISSMQGWRATMEDNHVASPSLAVTDGKNGNSQTVLEDHAVFGVFDGHGGNFTAQYAGDNFNRIFTARAEWTGYLSLDKCGRSESPGIELLKAAMTGAFLDIDEELCTIHQKRLSQLAHFHQKMGSKSHKGRRSTHGRRNTLGKLDIHEGNGLPPLPTLDSIAKDKIILDRSGSTAVVVLLTPTHILCSNAGDSRSILCHAGKALPLSFDHKPSNVVEHSRINEAGGYVRMKRIDGDLAVSRGLGDFRYKLNDDLPCEKQKVTANPDFMVTPRDHVKDEFVIVGCDGIWDVVDNGGCAIMVQEILDEGESDIGVICENVLDLCLERESKDNMTVCMIALPACRFSGDPIKR